MITKETLYDILLELGNTRKTGYHFQSTCPSCKKEGHFYINFKTLLGDCKKCGKAYNEYTFLQEVNKLYLFHGKKVDLKNGVNLLEQENVQEKEDIVKSLKKMSLPAGFRRIYFNQKNEYTDYLKKRKLTEEDFEYHKPGFTNLLNKYKGYILIPITLDFELRGFIGRWIHEDKNDILRYKNSKGSDFGELLDGYDELNSNTETLILVEGFFDRKSVDNELELSKQSEIKCCSTFGKKISDAQLNLIEQTNVKNVIMFYDTKDAVEQIKINGFKFSKKINVYGIFNFNIEKDPGSMVKDEILQALNNSQLIDLYGFSKVQPQKVKFF